MPFSALAPVLAAALTLATMQAAVWMANAVRNRDYRQFEHSNRAGIAQRFPLPETFAASAEERLEAFRPAINAAHKSANTAQTTYHSAVVRSAACIALAFVSLALTTLFPGDIRLQLFLSWTDAIALVAAVALFFHGRRTCNGWIALRSETELLRQYQFLALLFPSLIASPGADPSEDHLAGEFERVRAEAGRGDPTDIAVRVGRFWSDRRASIANAALDPSDLSPDALLPYLKKRVVRQLEWFSDSEARLRHIAERRKFALLGLYLVTVSLGIAKHVLLVAGKISPPYFQPLLLTATGLSAAMTAYYFNQNLRSLVHRYRAQRRTIDRWLGEFERLRDRSGASPAAGTAANDMRDHILVFEDMMVDELVDWIHITTHDAIELSS